MARRAGDVREDAAPRYRAPALEKGLDILELLASADKPMSVSQISQRLNRSISELFRMIQVLQFRGFILQAETGEGFVASDKLFRLAMERAPTRSLLEIGLPIMRELSTVTGQSCHLAVRSGGETVVVARVESGEQIGFTVRVGYRRSFALTGSGTVLFAYQGDRERERWLKDLSPEVTPQQIDALQARAEHVRVRGYEKAKSEFVAGVTDLAAPVLRGAAAAAALSVPFVHSTALVMAIDDVLKHLRSAAAEISASLLTADHRV